MILKEGPTAEYSVIESAPGPVTVIDGQPYLYFGGSAYLGLAGHPEVIEAGCTSLRRYGVHSATSRALTGTSVAVRDAEHAAARFFGCEDAFYFAGGYSANHILVSALVGGIDAVAVDEAAHYSVLEASRLTQKAARVFRHRDANDLERALEGAERALVMTDAVGPCMGDLAPVSDYLRVLEGKARAVLLLDDAHGFGVLGKCGRGLLEAANLWERANAGSVQSGVTIEVGGTLSKALGGFGGIIPGSREFIAQAKMASHYYDGASAPPSPVAAASAKALEIVMCHPELRQRLRDNAAHARHGLEGLGISVPHGETAHFGFSTGDAKDMQQVSQTLKQRGIYLPYVAAYAGVPPEGILRIAVFANHTPDHVDTLISELRAIL